MLTTIKYLNTKTNEVATIVSVIDDVVTFKVVDEVKKLSYNEFIDNFSGIVKSVNNTFNF